MTTGRGQPDDPPAGNDPDGMGDVPSVTPGGSVGDADPILHSFVEAPPPARRATDLGQRVRLPKGPEPGQIPASPAQADEDPGGLEDLAGRSPSDETGAEPHHGAGPDGERRRPPHSRISRAHPFGRRRVLPAAIVVAIAAGVLVAILGSAPGQRPIASTAGASPIADVGGYLVSLSELRKRAGDAARGIAPFADAVDDLQSWATSAVQRTPHPVQPLVVVGNDNVLVEDATRAYGLGLAYVATGDERFAAAVAATIRAWVHDVHWADDTCTDDGGCHTTLSISRAAPGFVFGAGLIADSSAWTAEDAATFRSWLRTVILPAASERPNNWGDAGTFMRVVVADYLREQSTFDTAIEKWRSLLDLIEADGRIPEESRRGAAGISYTQEALQYKLAVARIAELRGIDLWDAVGAKGGTLKVALDRLAYFSVHPREWPDAIDPEVPSPGPAWEIAYAHWPEPAWVPFVEAVRPYGDRGHSAIRWTTLTNGIPIDPITAGGSPSPSGSSPVGSTVPGASAGPSDPLDVPSLTSIRARLVDTSAPGDVRVRVSWSAPIGTDRVRLEWSTGGSWQRLVDSDRRSGSAVDARAAGTVSYRGRLTDGGRAGPWIELRDVVTERIDASATTLALRGAWSMAGGQYGGGTVLSTDQLGATATWRGPASDLLIIGPVGPTRGRLEVIVDGHLVRTVSLRASAYAARRVLATLHWPVTGDHQVVLRAAGVGGRTVAIDEIVGLESGSLSSPASVP